MNLIKPSVKRLWSTPDAEKMIEQIGRVCYKSEDKITGISARPFIKMLITRGHEAMLEHASMSYHVVCDRGVTHEIVRHRLFSYAQESTRYCNYKGGVTFIKPCWCEVPEQFMNTEVRVTDEAICNLDIGMDMFGSDTHKCLQSMQEAETSYQELIASNWKPQQARAVLPNSLKTEIVITGNMREWRHFFELRTARAAHPQMREIANMILYDAVNEVSASLFGEYADGNEEYGNTYMRNSI